MANKTINSRIQLKHDTAQNWSSATTFIPLAGEVILYTDINKIKVGDGTTTVVNLPFADTTEGYLLDGVFYKEAAHTNVIPAGTGTMYVDLSTNKIYRYSGSAYVMIGGQDIADFTGATASAAGAHGLVPAPAAGDQDKFLKADGTWAEVSSTDILRATHVIVAGEESAFTSPITISNINKTVVYHNGILLTYGTNYTVANNIITLNGYQAEIGDIFTVVTNSDGGTTALTNTYTETFSGPGTYSEGLTTFTITHNLNSMAVLAQVYDSTGANVVCEIVRTSVNVITLIFNGALTSSQSFTIVVMSPSYKTIDSAEQEEF